MTPSVAMSPMLAMRVAMWSRRWRDTGQLWRVRDLCACSSSLHVLIPSSTTISVILLLYDSYTCICTVDVEKVQPEVTNQIAVLVEEAPPTEEVVAWIQEAMWRFCHPYSVNNSVSLKSHTYSHSHSHTHTHSYSLTHTLAHTHSHTHSLTHSKYQCGT